MRHSIRGFTLIEIVVVLLILAIVIAMASAITRGVGAAQKRSLTATRMATVDAALVQYVSQQKRLPCPADGTRSSADNNAGKEVGWTATGCSPITQQFGVVPWRELGLSETDASDGWDRRLTYRLDPVLAATNGMNMSWCDPAGIGPLVAGVCRADGACSSTTLASCTPPSLYLANKGLQVRKADGTTVIMDPAGTPHTGAAYVVISHGETGGGGYLSSGIRATTTSTGDSASEGLNYGDTSYGAGYYYVDDSLDESAGNHFDDIISRPTVLSVVTKAGLGPRAH
jgi:prepilin-type N-terminal cleavage/methylation domain-containing protein